jgi:hypothetical protein
LPFLTFEILDGVFDVVVGGQVKGPVSSLLGVGLIDSTEGFKISGERGKQSLNPITKKKKKKKETILHFSAVPVNDEISLGEEGAD